MRLIDMLYTGVTRAKKLLVLIGSRKALRYSIQNVTVTQRNTKLRNRLADSSAWINLSM